MKMILNCKDIFYSIKIFHMYNYQVFTSKAMNNTMGKILNVYLQNVLKIFQQYLHKYNSHQEATIQNIIEIKWLNRSQSSTGP